MMFCWVGFVCLMLGGCCTFLRSLKAQGGLEPSVTKADLQLSFVPSPSRCFPGMGHHVWHHGDFCQGSEESSLQLSSLCPPSTVSHPFISYQPLLTLIHSRVLACLVSCKFAAVCL